MFGGDTQSLTEALAYAKANGGGTIAVSSQSGAGAQVIDGADVVAIGGFSGRESEVTRAVARRGRPRRQGPLGAGGRDGGGAGFNDGRTGSRSRDGRRRSTTCKRCHSVDGLYDCQGYEDALAASDG